MQAIVALLLVLGCAAEEGPKVKKVEEVPAKKLNVQAMTHADWSNPKRTFMKFFGTKGLTSHSLSDAQLAQLAKQVQNKTEWKPVSMSTYWDCSYQYCLKHKPGREAMRKNSCPNIHNEMWHRGPRSIDHASESIGLFEHEGGLFGTVAASGSLGVDENDALGCGKCYAIRRGDEANFGGFRSNAKLTVMVSNWCPASRDAPCPAAGKIGSFGTPFHFDLAVPGGGQGTMPTCANTYAKEDGRNLKELKEAFNNTLEQCHQLPKSLRQSCTLYRKVAQYPLNLGLAFAEVECPAVLSARFGCRKTCDDCEDELSYAKLQQVVKRGEGKLSKLEQAAFDAKKGVAEYKAANPQSFRQKLKLQKK